MADGPFAGRDAATRLSSEGDIVLFRLKDPTTFYALYLLNPSSQQVVR